MSKTYFISDCHLSADSPKTLSLFARVIQSMHGAKALYILGDLFDVWVGDDVTSPTSIQVAKLLQDLKQSGTQLYFMAGNRDFLLGKKFAVLAGWQVLADYHVLQDSERRILLTHGDLLCTDDKAYQRYRKLARNPITLWLYRHLPKKLRLRIAAKLRKKSKAYQASVNPTIIDANQDAIKQVMHQHQVNMLVHGHTHRPQIENLTLGQRVVLGDWHADNAVIAMLEKGKLTLINAADKAQPSQRQIA